MSPTALADALCRPGAVLLDAPRPDADTGRRGARLFTDPLRVLTAETPDDVGPLLARLDAALAEGAHVAGFLSYEAGTALEWGQAPVASPTDPAVPLAWFGEYERALEVGDAEVDAALATVGEASVHDLQFGLEEEAYRAKIEAIKAHIREGNVYQINLTVPFNFGLEGDPLALFAALRRRQSVAYGAFVQTDRGAVASVSPELFFRIDPDPGGRTITARPMKGTAPSGASRADGARIASALRASEKDRAENLMIVDLLRNDLARVSEPGSVCVPELFETERYDTVTQMTSTVRARVQPEAQLGDVLRALFPCGSVTGAPKLRAMGIIRDLEVGPRGVYCGAIGSAGPDGTAAFNVAIRTAVVADGRGRYDVGSGVVWDSEAGAEYAECLLKARVLTDLAR